MLLPRCVQSAASHPAERRAARKNINGQQKITARSCLAIPARLRLLGSPLHGRIGLIKGVQK